MFLLYYFVHVRSGLDRIAKVCYIRAMDFPAAVAVPVQARIVEMDPLSGNPVLKIVPMFTRSQVSDMVRAAVAQPYEDPLGLEPEFEGMTCMEVMLIKLTRRAAQSGFPSDIAQVLDRILGKPGPAVALNVENKEDGAVHVTVVNYADSAGLEGLT